MTPTDIRTLPLKAIRRVGTGPKQLLKPHASVGARLAVGVMMVMWIGRASTALGGQNPLAGKGRAVGGAGRAAKGVSLEDLEPGSLSFMPYVEDKYPDAFGAEQDICLDFVKPDFLSLNVEWEKLLRPKGAHGYGFDFGSVDRALEHVRQKGYKVRLLFYMAEARLLPPELKEEVERDQNGEKAPIVEGTLSWHNCLSQWGPRSNQVFYDLIKAGVQRYLDSPQIVEWNFFSGWSENHHFEGVGKLYDYSFWTKEKFRWYLQYVKGYTLQDVKRRSGTNLQDWQSIEPPKPQFTTDLNVDTVNLSPFWADWQDFRLWSTQQRLDSVCKIVRIYDKRRRIMNFNNMDPYNCFRDAEVMPLQSAAMAQKYNGGFYVTSSDNYMMSVLTGAQSRKRHVPFSMECGYGPFYPLRWSTFLHNVFESGAYYVNLYVAGRPTEAATPSMLRVLKNRGMIKELLKCQFKERKVGASLSYATGLTYGSLLWSMYTNSSCQPVWARQLNVLYSANWSGYELEPVADMDDDYSLGGFVGVLEPGSLVLPDKVIKSMAGFVRGGGKMVLFGDSGRYVYGAERQTGHALASALGYATEETWPAAPIQGRSGWLEPLFEVDHTESYDSAILRSRHPGYTGNAPELVKAQSVRCRSSGSLLGEGFEFHIAYPYTLPKPQGAFGREVKIEAVDASGNAVAIRWPFGRGEVLMIGGFPDFNEENGHLVTDKLLAWLGAEKRVKIDPNLRLRTIHKLRGPTHYYVLTSTQPHFLKANLEFVDLPARKRYRVADKSWNSHDYGLVADEGGGYKLPLYFEPFETKILRFTPGE